MKKVFQWAMAAALICGTMAFTSCSSNDDNPATPDNPATGEVRLTQQYMVAVRSTGDTLMVTTEDFVWENGLLRSSHILMNIVGSTSEVVNNYI